MLVSLFERFFRLSATLKQPFIIAHFSSSLHVKTSPANAKILGAKVGPKITILRGRSISIETFATLLIRPCPAVFPAHVPPRTLHHPANPLYSIIILSHPLSTLGHFSSHVLQPSHIHHCTTSLE